MVDRGYDQFVFVSSDWELDPQSHCLKWLATGETEHLGPQCADVLELLCRCNGETVTRTRFIDEIWHGSYAVGDRGLRQAIWRIRRALKHCGKDRQLVTVPRVGYRLECSELAMVSRTERKRNWFNIRVGMGLAAVSIPFVLFAVSQLAPIINRIDESSLIGPGIPANHFKGVVETPAVSASEDRIAYAAQDEQGRWTIQVESTDRQSPVIQIGPHANKKLLEPVFSPTGERLAYLKRLNSQNSLIEYSLIVHDLDTGREEILSSAHGVQTVQPGLDWSSDGHFLIFPQATAGELPIRIVELDLRTRQVRSVTEPELIDIGPVYMPNSRDFSFARLPDASGADIYASIEGRIRRLTDRNAYIHSHAWLDDNRFVLAMYRDGAYRAFLGRVGSTELLELRVDPGFRTPAIAGNSIYWIRSSYSIGSRIMSLSEPGDTWLLEPVGLVRKDVAIHPQEPLFAVVDDRSGYEEIWISGFHGKSERQLTKARSRLISPRWSPDGRMLVARLDDPEAPKSRPVRIDLDTGELIEITPPDVSLVGFLFSADGRWGAAIGPAATPEIWRLSLHSPDEAERVFAGSIERFWVFSGSEIGFLSDGEAHIVDLATGTARKVSIREFEALRLRHQPRMEWQTDDERMVLIDHEDPSSPKEIFAVDISSTPGYGFAVESRQKIAAWNEYVTLKKRLYRAPLQ